MRIDPTPALLIASLGWLSGCYSGLHSTPDPDDDPDGVETAGPERGDIDGEEPAGPGVGAYRLMRLTRSEYDNTVQDLLGVEAAPALDFAPDEKVGPFDANVIAPPSEVMLQNYMDAAEDLASAAVQDVAGLTGCTVDELGGDACAQRFIDDFGRRAYRRPLEATERERHLAVFSTGMQLRGFDHGIELVVRAMLQSPNFLYRVEQGVPIEGSPGLSRLDDWEIASRLSYFLWDSMPDDRLLDAAEAGELQDAEGIEAQARRLLESPKAEPMVAAFHVQLMGLGSTVQKDPDIFPQFTDTLVDSMRREVGMFATDVILHGDSQVSSLLASSHTFVDAQLASVYDIEHPGDDPDAFVRVELDPARRAGLLTQPGYLAATSHAETTSAVFRGRFVRVNLLCQDIPLPPPRCRRHRAHVRSRHVRSGATRRVDRRPLLLRLPCAHEPPGLRLGPLRPHRCLSHRDRRLRRGFHRSADRHRCRRCLR